MAAPAQSEALTLTERLKSEGNTLYGKGDFEGARRKYTDALEKDPLNAFLYANRAATYLAEKQYLDAAWDCQKAVELDPTYAKAWGRLGSAAQSLQSWDYCIRAYRKGIECFPSNESTLTSAQKTLKAQFEEGLRKAEASRDTPPMPFVRYDKETVSRGLPWDRAKFFIMSKNPPRTSSAWVIHEASGDFKHGLEVMQKTEVKQTPRGPIQMGNTDGIISLVNAVICDERCFYIDDKSFFDKVTTQSQFENRARRGWAEATSAAVVKREAVKRLKSEGWAAVRPALSTTVRIWLFHAYLKSELPDQGEAALEGYTRAIEVLEWGRQKWAGVSKDDRGVVFEKSFIRGVKRLKMQHMHKVLVTAGPKPVPFTKDDLVGLAEDLIGDVDSDPAWMSTTPGQASAFWAYVKGSALSMLGWDHLSQGAHRLAAEYYEKAAMSFPDDDENHAYFLRMALDCLCNAEAPLKEVLPMSKRVRTTIPKALEIWQGSSMTNVLRGLLKDLEVFEMHQMHELKEGKATMETVARIKPVLPPKFDVDGRAYVDLEEYHD